MCILNFDRFVCGRSLIVLKLNFVFVYFNNVINILVDLFILTILLLFYWLSLANFEA